MSDDYKTYAEIIEEAKRTKSERERKAYLELEMAWSGLADEVSSLRRSSVPPDKSIAFH